MTKVVHMRLPEADILSCFELLENTGQKVHNLPVATAVSQALNLLMKSLRQSGDVTKYKSQDDVILALSKYIDREPSGLPRINLDDIATMAESLNEEEDLEDEDWADVLEGQIQNGVGAGRVNEPPSEPQHQHESIVKSTPVWESQPRLSLPELVERSPKDRYVEAITESKENGSDPWELQLAVGIVYRHIPQDLWGTSKADAFIKDMLEVIRADTQQFGRPEL